MTSALKRFVLAYCVVTFAFWTAALLYEAFWYDPGFTGDNGQPVEPVFTALLAGWLYYFIPIRITIFVCLAVLVKILSATLLRTIVVLIALTFVMDIVAFVLIGKALIPILMALG